MNLTVYTNANWTSNIDDKRFTGGYYIYMENSLISWSLGKQKVVFRYSTKIEF